MRDRVTGRPLNAAFPLATSIASSSDNRFTLTPACSRATSICTPGTSCPHPWGNETTPGIPLIRLSVINPFLKELASRNCAAHSRRRSHRERAAKLCGIDKRQLSRKLRNKGTTINKEIAYLRQERATSALANSGQRISDIAAKVGFGDATVFSGAFKNWTGQSPQEYRRSHKN